MSKWRKAERRDYVIRTVYGVVALFMIMVFNLTITAVFAIPPTIGIVTGFLVGMVGAKFFMWLFEKVRRESALVVFGEVKVESE